MHFADSAVKTLLEHVRVGSQLTKNDADIDHASDFSYGQSHDGFKGYR